MKHCPLVLAAGVALLAFGGGTSAQQQPPGLPQATRPADGFRVPADAAFLVSVRVADIWNSAPVKGLRQQKAQELAEGLKGFEKEIGVGPADMERVTAVMTDFKGRGPLLFITTLKPYDHARILATVLSGGKPERHQDQILFVSDKNQAVCFLSDRTYVLGAVEVLRTYLDRPAAQEGPVGDALHLTNEKHQIIGGLNVAGLAQAEGGHLPPDLEAFKDLLRARSATCTIDLGEQNKAELRLNFADAAEAKHAEKPLRSAIDLARAVLLAQSLQNPPPQPGGGAGLAELLKLVNAALQTASIEQKGTALQVNVSIKADTATAVATLVEGVHRMRQSANRMQSANNLKQLALAMHNYHDTYGHFPPPAVYSKDGKPLLSWRVLLLPFLEQDALYRAFKLDEAWDSPHNVRLLAQMPKVFRDPTVDSKEPMTVYQAFVGPGALFEENKELRIADIPDGTSNTLMFVEAARPVPWSKPEDLAFVPNGPLPKLGGHEPGGFTAAFCDGSVRFLKQSIPENILRALITRNGGEVIGPNDL